MSRTKEWNFRNYKDALEVICAVIVGWDGYNPDDAKQMRELAIELSDIASNALKEKPVFLNGRNQSVWDKNGNFRKFKNTVKIHR